MIPFIFLAILVALVLFVAGFLLRNGILAGLAGILWMVLGVHVLVSGVMEIDNVLTLALGSIFMGAGAYVFIRSGIEMIGGG